MSRDTDAGKGDAFPETADIETASNGYAARFAGPVGEWMLSVQERLALACLEEGGGAKILDVGGGHGQLAGPLCESGYVVTVTGSSEVCGRRVDDLVRNGRCRFEVVNTLEMPYDDSSFDHVVCFRLITHCERWQEVVKELCRVARKSVIIDYPTSQSLNAIAPKLFAAKKKIEKNTRTWRLFRHQELEDEFGKYGFTVQQRSGQFFLPMVLHRTLGCRRVSQMLEGICRRVGLTGLWGSPVVVKAARDYESRG